MSAFAGAGAAAWVVPEILTAKPAAGASISQHTGGGGGGTTGGTTNPTTNPSTTNGGAGAAGGSNPATLTSATGPGTSSTLAYTGLNIQRDAEIGAALVAGGWAMHHWASRAPKPATAAAGDVHEAGSADTPT
jgi:hypothetical protein